MTQMITTQNGNGRSQSASDLMEAVLIKGDLSKLSPAERGSYYTAVCNSLGLNPLTKPFDYLTLGGKLVLYANRACTDQLRTIHNVSVEELGETEREGVFVVTAKVKNGEGRTDMAKGAVNIAGLKGDNLANALMKAETKAKRRATLSLCGLGMLDELEIETIPGQRKNPHVTRPEDVVDIPAADDADNIPEGSASVKVLAKGATRAEFERAQKEMYAITDLEKLKAWANANADRFQIFHPEYKDILRGLLAAHRSGLKAQKSQGHDPETGEVNGDAAIIAAIDNVLSQVTDPGMLEPTWDYQCEPRMADLKDHNEALAIYRKHEQRLSA